MFGYLAADLRFLEEEQAKRYKACYCGLCHTLKMRHGQLTRLTLNYDLTFLVLLLGSLYEPEETSSQGRCLVHPWEEKSWWYSEAGFYAADMNVMLAYLKCMDNWRDDSNLISLAEAAALKKAYLSLAERYPRQHSAMLSALNELSSLENAGIEDADAASAAFGRFMAELLVWREDRWSATLRAMGEALGRFIYIMDAVMDLDRDTFRNSYNPFRRYYGLKNEQRFRDILKMLLSECVYRFDLLPLVKDTELMKNILCFGLWQQFDRKYSSGVNADVSGPL